MQRKRNEGGGLAGGGLAVLQRNRTVHSENRLAHNEDRPDRNEDRLAHNEDHHNIRRFSPKTGKASNVVMVCVEDGLGKSVLLEATCPVVRVSA